MDKKILSTAIAGVLAGSMAFAANADVTLYGQIDMSIDSIDVDNPNRIGDDASLDGIGSTSGDDINMNSNYSALGVKGSEDLGGGLKAIFQAEFQFDPDENSTFTGARDSWVGMQGAFGKVRFGRMSTTYKDSGAMIDPMWRTAFDSRDGRLISALHSGTDDNGAGRATNAVGYNTPDFNGLSGAATYSFDGDCTVGSETSVTDGDYCGADDDSYSLGARYNNGPALVYADYITSDKGDSDSAYKIGGKYSFGDFGVFGQYEFDDGMISSRGGAGNTEEDADVWMLGGTYTMGNVLLTAAYGQGDDSNDPLTNTEYDAWQLTGAYSFSKRTMAYAGFNQISDDCTNCGESDHFALGMRHKF